MKKFLIWILAFIITIAAAYYQRKTGPTYPKRENVTLNGTLYELNLVRSIGLDEPSEVKLDISDSTINAKIYFKRYKSQEDYQSADFTFRSGTDKGFYVQVPQQPAAGKLQYFIEISDSVNTQKLFEDTPVVIRFKGGVPAFVLVPHILIMFIAMLFSTAAGLFGLFRMPAYKKTGLWTLLLLTAGGMILGPIVQKYAFGELWTGVPYGWDLTDNKTLIAFVFWLFAVIISWKKDRPVYTVIASVVLLLVYSIPHSIFGSELDYTTGQVTQGLIFTFFLRKEKKS